MGNCLDEMYDSPPANAPQGPRRKEEVTGTSRQAPAHHPQYQVHGSVPRTVSKAEASTQTVSRAEASTQTVSRAEASNSQHTDQAHGSTSQMVSKTKETNANKHRDQVHSNSSQTVSKVATTDTSKHRVHSNAPPKISKAGVSARRQAKATHQVHAHGNRLPKDFREQIDYIIAWSDPLHQHKVHSSICPPYTTVLF